MKKNRADLSCQRLPRLNDLVKIRSLKVTFVDWRSDYNLRNIEELPNVKDSLRFEANRTRKKLYEFLENL